MPRKKREKRERERMSERERKRKNVCVVREKREYNATSIKNSITKPYAPRERAPASK